MGIFLANLGVAAITGVANWIRERNASTKASAEEANATYRNYNELVRQQHEQVNLFGSTMGRTYGSGFLQALQGGKTTSDLIGSIGQDTALGKNLAMYEKKANLAVANAKMANQEAYQMATMQGQSNLTNILAQDIAAKQASGQAASAQASSGIRSDRGTGANMVEAQEQQNKIAARNMSQQIAMQNKSTMLGMQAELRSASQQAQALRDQMNLDALSAVEDALNRYDQFLIDMRDMDVSQQSLLDEAKDYTNDAGFNAWRVNEEIRNDDVKAEDIEFV